MFFNLKNKKIQLLSTSTKVRYSQLYRYSQLVRQNYQELHTFKTEMPTCLQNFQKESKISDENTKLFFKLLQNENVHINDSNFSDFYKLSKFFQVKKLLRVLEKYSQVHHFDITFISSQLINYFQLEENNTSEHNDLCIKMEKNLSDQIENCFQNEKFKMLPIPVIYRIVSKSDKNKIINDLMFDYIIESISTRFALLSFIDLQKLSDSKFDQLYKDFINSKETNSQSYYAFLPNDISYIKLLRDNNQKTKSQLDELELKAKNAIKIEEENCLGLNFLNQIKHPFNFTTAISILNSSSEKGSQIASFLLGLLYESDSSWLRQDFTKSISFYLKSSEQGSSTAFVNLGMLYENGKGVEKDYNKAFEFYQKAAEHGNSIAMCNLGLFYEKGRIVDQNFIKAIELYEKSAKQGNSYALCSLAKLFEDGKGVDQNYSKAIELYNQSANQGNSFALLNLGLIYEFGKGVDQDFSAAFNFYTKSADQGNSSALLNIGYLYEVGRGVNQNIPKAIMYYKRKAELDKSCSLFFSEKTKNIEENMKSGLEYYGSTTHQNIATQLFNLGFIYEKGIGVEQNYLTSFKYYKKSSKLGNKMALYVLGLFFERGQGIRKNNHLALWYYKRAFRKGISNALINIGLLYEKRKDYTHALSYYSQ